MATGEWFLVLFTVLSQMAVGYLIFVVRPAAGRQNPVLTWLLPAGLLGLALLVSLGHLGHPEGAYRALSNLSSSWLSREVLFFGLSFLALVIAVLSERGQKAAAARLAATFALGTGLLGVLASSLIYLLPARPAWNNFQTVLSFFLTSFLLGMSLAALVKQYRPEVPVGFSPSTCGFVVSLLLLLSLISSISYLTFLAAAGPEARMTLSALLASPWWWLRVVTGWLVPLSLSYRLLRQEEGLPSITLSLFILLLVGEFLGRALFYGAAVPLGIG